MAEGSLRQPGADHLDSPHSDPFDLAGGNLTQTSDDNEGDQIKESEDSHWKELDPFDVEDESQQKLDPDTDSGVEEEDEDPQYRTFGALVGKH